MPPGPPGSAFSPGPRAGFPRGGYGAGNTVSIDLPNLGQLLGRFKQYGAGVEVQVQRMAEVIADDIVVTAKDLVAIDTEKTKDSIRRERRGRDVFVVVDRLGDRPEVPIYLEIGTYKMAARPFLKPSADLVLASGGLMRASTQVGGLLAPTGARHTPSR